MVPAILVIFAGHAQKSPPFVGDLFAGMPDQKAAASSFEEDQQRAQQDAHWIRIVFSKESRPKFAELVIKRLKERWNPNLGYDLVFGESRGPREAEATAGTIRISIQTFSSNMQYETQPETERFIWAVELIARKEKYDMATSWDDLHISGEKRLPQRFALAPDRVEAFNREQMGQIYADFKKALDAVPEFSFFPGPDFDLVRPLFTYRPTDTAPALSPAGFTQEVTRLFDKHFPIYRSYLGRIAVELVRHGANDYYEGICSVFADWNQELHKQKIEVLRSNLGFANYQLIKCLAARPDARILIHDIPEMKADPALAGLEQSGQRTGADAIRAAAYAPPPAPKPIDPLKLQAIFFGARLSAIIGGHTVFVGDKVGDYQVARIEQQTVTLQASGGQTKVLRLTGQ